MIGVKVRRQHAQQRPAGEQGREQLFPIGARVVIADAAIDLREARDAIDLIVEQPQVDVIERKRQPHAQPMHPRPQRDHRARRRDISPRISQLVFAWVHNVGSRFGVWRLAGLELGLEASIGTKYPEGLCVTTCSRCRSVPTRPQDSTQCLRAPGRAVISEPWLPNMFGRSRS